MKLQYKADLDKVHQSVDDIEDLVLQKVEQLQSVVLQDLRLLQHFRPVLYLCLVQSDKLLQVIRVR